MSSRRFTVCAQKTGKKPTVQVAELLLVRGLAQVVRHRSDDERSQHYESLMNAEASGMSSRKGMHNKSKDPPVHYYNDVSLPSTSANQAKQYLPFFQRGKQKGVVEFVLSGARLKVCCVSVAVQTFLHSLWKDKLSSTVICVTYLAGDAATKQPYRPVLLVSRYVAALYMHMSFA